MPARDEDSANIVVAGHGEEIGPRARTDFRGVAEGAVLPQQNDQVAVNNFIREGAHWKDKGHDFVMDDSTNWMV